MSLPIEEWRRIHDESIANAGGSFEIETDEALRIAARDHLPALLDELAELRACRASDEVALRENLRRDKAYLIARHTEELAELRAYRASTEAALVRLCRQAGDSPADYAFLAPDHLLDEGLWREPKADKLQP